MREILIIAFAGLVFSNCSEEKTTRCYSGSCSMEATVVDLRSMDGCDFAFELKDGSRLIPERRTYVQAPTKEADPAYYYQFQSGARVTVGYEESSVLSACMAGRMVFITCISDLKNSDQ